MEKNKKIRIDDPLLRARANQMLAEMLGAERLTLGDLKREKEKEKEKKK